MARPAPKPRKYEMMIVVAPTVTEDGLPAVVERVTGLIETHEGTVESSNHDSPWGHRRLAYPIQNFRDAFYVLYYFDIAPREIQELDRELRLEATIIRHLIVKFDPLTVREIGLDGGDEGDDDDVEVASDDGDEDEVVEASADDDAAEADEDIDEAEDDGDDEDDDGDADEVDADDTDDEEADEADADEDEDEDDDEAASEAADDDEEESESDEGEADDEDVEDDGEEDEE